MDWIFHCLIIAFSAVLTNQQPADVVSSRIRKSNPGISYNYFKPIAATYDYGYTTNRTGPFQFEQHTGDNTTTGCYGQLDESGQGRITYYIADSNGYRVIRPTKSNQNQLPQNCQKLFSTPASTEAPLSDPIILDVLVPPQPPSGAFADSRPIDVVAQFRAIQDVCISVLHVPEEYRNLTWRYPYPDTHYMKCLLRCAAVISGAYTDEGGMNLEMAYKKLHADTGSPLSKEQFMAESQECLGKVDGDALGAPVDICEKFYPMYGCFERRYYEVLGWTDGPPAEK